MSSSSAWPSSDSAKAMKRLPASGDFDPATSAMLAGTIAVCFGHAYLGARIGGQRANRIAVFFLLGCLVALILWMKHAIDAGR